TPRLPGDAGAILLVDERQRATHRKLRGLRESAPHRSEPRVLGGFLGRCATAEGLLVAEGGELWELGDRIDGRASGVRHAMAMPLRSRDRLIGIACIACTGDCEFSLDNRQLFRVLADRAAVMIDNALLF